MKSKLFNCTLNNENNEIYLERYSLDALYEMKFPDLFIKELHNKNVYNEIIDIFSNDNCILWNCNNNYDFARQMVEDEISENFKNLYNHCNLWSKSKINEVILSNMNFKDFFEDNEMIYWLYKSYRINDILKACKNENENENVNEVLKYAYESQRGNQLLLITFYVLKKIEEKDFMEELEKNYGIYLKMDEFVNELKKKLNEIKTYKNLYKFIGTEFGNDKSDLELIITGYERAKTKGYIRKSNSSETFSIGRGRGHLRGRVLGRKIFLRGRGREYY
jgi:hypothetical protein